MFKNGNITCCPVCKNEDEEKSVQIGLSKEFGVPFIECKVCEHSSVRDLTHGIENDDIPSHKSRTDAYAEAIKSHYCADSRVLEIGPGDYRLSNRLSKGSMNVTSIDVGKSFLVNKSEEVNARIVQTPKSPEEIFNVSQHIYTIAKDSASGLKYDLGVSLHSWEHSPDPVTMIKAISDHCEDFIIEVPNGESQAGRKKGTVKNDTIVPNNYLEKNPGATFPILPPGKRRGSGKGTLVGGHYQIFTGTSIEWIARNLLSKDKNYFIGGSIFSNDRNSICISTREEFVEQKKGIPFIVVQNVLTF